MPISVVVQPAPSFTLSPVQADGVRYLLTSTSSFPDFFPRSSFALFARVQLVDSSLPVPVRSPADPLLAVEFPVELTESGVYTVRLVAFPVEDPDLMLATAPVDHVFYNQELRGLQQVVEAGGTRSLVSIESERVGATQIPYSSSSQTLVHLTPTEAVYDQLLGQLLDYQLSGQQQLRREESKRLRENLLDLELAMHGVRTAVRQGRVVEAQRHVRLLQKLALHCTC